MVWDSARSKLVLLADGVTWKWDTKVWTKSNAPGPSARTTFSMAFDASRSRTVVFGGLDEKTVKGLGDTWEWDGASWAQKAVSGPSRRRHGLRFLPRENHSFRRHR